MLKDRVSRMDNDSNDDIVIGSQNGSIQGAEEEEQDHIMLFGDDVPPSEFELFANCFNELLLSEKIEIREFQENINQNPNKEVASRDVSRINKLMQHVTHDSRMHQQIIPNVNRIKIEKYRALLRQQAKRNYIDSCEARKKKADLTSFNMDSNPQDQELKQNGQHICPWSYYMENLFSQDDLLLYRSVVMFYANNFSECINDL